VAKKGLTLKIGELHSDIASLRNVNISIGAVTGERWGEPMGPTPFPSLTTLRSWDHILLDRYKPFYLPFCDLCCLCTFGKCDLTGNKRGACGIDMAAQQSRIVLLASSIGAATHIAHARDLVGHVIGEFGRSHPIDVGGNAIEVEAPHTRLVCGIKPETLGDLEEILEYCENQVTQLLAVTHTGQEGSCLDFESKVLHAGMIDHVGMEIADIAQISAYAMPKADPESPLVDLGMGTVDIRKPVILVIGHAVPPAAGIIDYMRDNDLESKIELTGICCTALDMTRYSSQAKIIGPISWQLRYIRSGVPDLIVIDEQCIRCDTLVEAAKIQAPVIATSEKNCCSLPDRTADPAEEIVSDLVSGRIPGALILDTQKVGEVAVRTVSEVAKSAGNSRTSRRSTRSSGWPRSARSVHSAGGHARTTSPYSMR